MSRLVNENVKVNSRREARLKENKKQWLEEIKTQLLNEFEEVEYKGYNNIVPIFSDIITTFNLGKNLKVDCRIKDLKKIGFQYSDGYTIYSEKVGVFTIIEKYDMIFDTIEMQELKDFLYNFYDLLVDCFTAWYNEMELHEIELYRVDYILFVNDFINNYRGI